MTSSNYLRFSSWRLTIHSAPRAATCGLTGSLNWKSVATDSPVYLRTYLDCFSRVPKNGLNNGSSPVICFIHRARRYGFDVLNFPFGSAGAFSKMSTKKSREDCFANASVCAIDLNSDEIVPQPSRNSRHPSQHKRKWCISSALPH